MTSKTRNLLIGGAIVLVLIIFAVLTYVREKNEEPNVDNIEIYTDSTRIEIEAVDSSIISKIDSMLFENEISKVKYHVIVGSFKDVENAKKFQYIYPDCKILPMTDSGFHRVSILEYDKVEDCVKKVLAFRENNGDAWMLIQK